MVKHLFLCAMLFCSLTLSAFNREIDIENEAISIRYNFEKLNYVTSESDSTKIIPHIDGFGSFTDIGFPSLPKLSETFEIPDGYTIQSISCICNIDTIKLYKEVSLSLPPNTDNSIENITTVEPKPTGDIWPPEFVRILNSGTYRDINIGSFELMPVKYDSHNSVLYFCKDLTVKLTLKSSPESDSDSQLAHSINRSDLNNLTSIKINRPESALLFTNQDKNVAKEPIGYLIVCPKEFEDPAQKLASWKRRLGFNVSVSSLSSEICTSPNLLKSYIKDKYITESNLEYVLLLGGGNKITPFKGLYNPESAYTYYTDYYFGCMDGENDIVSDLKLGRLPAQNVEEAYVMVNKTINYEWMPPTEDDDYYNRASHAAYFESDNTLIRSSRRFVLTSEDILNYVSLFGKNIDRIYTAAPNSNPMYWSTRYSYGEEIPSYLQKPNFLWNGNSTNLVNQINDGRFYVLYRGHGSETSFQNINFDNDNIAYLNNIEHLPVVFGITCLSGRFYNPNSKPNTSSSISESLLTHPFGGAVAVIAATRQSYSGFNEHFTGGLFNSLFPNPGCSIDANREGKSSSDFSKQERALGALLMRGNQKQFEAYGESQTEIKPSFARYNMEIFHCLGDPSLKMYTSAPKLTRPVYLCEGGRNIYLDSDRDVVLVNKFTNEVKIIGCPIRLPLEEYLDNYYVSLISDTTVPIQLNHSALPITDDISTIESISQDDSNCIIKIKNAHNSLSLDMYDIYGQRIDYTSVSDNIVKMKKHNGFIIVSLSISGTVIDRKSIIIK